MRTLSDARSAGFLADLDRLDTRLAKIQQQVSSGYRISVPSDAPEDVVDVVQLRADISRADAAGSSLRKVQSEVSAAEASMQVATRLLERARTIAAQGATATAQNRPALAAEVRGLHEQLVAITRTQSAGRYVFSGDSDQAPLYDVDLTQSAGVARLATAANTREVVDVHGTPFGVTRTAAEIFDTRDALDVPDGKNAFNALYQLSIALTNDDRTGVQDAATLLGNALDHIGQQVTFYGDCQTRLASAIDEASKTSLHGTKELSDIEDTDLTQAVVDLTTAKTHREAALGMWSQKPKTSLFDYLG